MARGESWIARPRGACGLAPKCRSRRPDQAGRYLLFAIVGLVMASVTALGQLSGQFGLDLVARRIPTTLADEIALDAPSEFAMLEFGIYSNLAVTVDCGFADLKLDMGTNMAGPEHAVGVADVQVAPIPLNGALVDNIHLIGEIWFAVPFEGVTDVNNLPNCVVIPPGDPLFVATRFTASFECAGFTTRCLFMLQDVGFPAPSAPFTPLFYEQADQDFGLGTILSTSWSSPLGSSLNLTLGFNASQSATVVKGYSASGRVDSGECTADFGNYFLNGSIGGIPLCDIPIGIVTLADAKMGIGFNVSTTQTLSATVSISAKVAEDVGFSTSFTLFKDPVTSTGLNISGSLGCFDAGVSLDKLAITSLSAGCNTPFSLGALTGSFGVSATGLDKGLTGLSARLALSQGLFSAGTNVAFAQRGDHFGFASLGTQFAFRIPPGTISIQATFSRYGLTRAGISSGVTF
jgi:hypothetical protein